ncbi:MAG: sugar ABC transporter permease [Pseudomonadota bacterium]
MSAATKREASSGRDHPLPWLAPALLTLAAFYAVPVLDVFRLAFSDATLIRPPSAYSLDAFSDVLSNAVLPGILGTTLAFTVLSVIALQLAGLLIALLLARGERRKLPGMSAFRTLVLAAWVVPGIANGLIWQILFDEAPYGTLNSLIGFIGLGPVAWLSDPTMAMTSAIVANVWQGTAFSMVVFYAARKSIDPTLYEVASVDGANAWEKFWAITLPQLRLAIAANTILVTVQTLNTFDSILALTGGGPGRATEVLALFTFNTVFFNLDLAGGSVLALILFVLGLAFATLTFGWLRRVTA